MSTFLKAVLSLLSNEFEASKIDFYGRKFCLETMSHTLKTVNMITDERIIYKADEVIRMYGYKGLYTLLLTIITQLYYEM